jgi:hypothetical protein
MYYGTEHFDLPICNPRKWNFTSKDKIKAEEFIYRTKKDRLEIQSSVSSRRPKK